MSELPNILLVVTDEQRPDLFGAAGVLPVQTPAIDRLCAEGMTLERAYAACPLCAPSRAGIISGQYGSRNGSWTNGVPSPDDILSVPALLGDQAGYRTAMIGKSHLRNARPADGAPAPGYRPKDGDDIRWETLVYDWDFFHTWTGPWFGYEYARLAVGHVYSPTAYALHYGSWLNDRGIPREPPYFMTRQQALEVLGDVGMPEGYDTDTMRGTEPFPPTTWALPEEYCSSKWVADETISYIRDHAGSGTDRPFMLAAHFPDPHPPFAAPDPWASMYEGIELPAPRRRLGEWDMPGKPEFYRATLEHRVKEMGWHDDYVSISPKGLITHTEERTPREDRWWRSYLGMQSLLDKHFGRILDTLDELGMTEDTLVVYTSDHGEQMGDHFLWHKGPLHYDAGARVPMIARWPGRIPAGTKSRSLQSLVDLAPTFMSAAGLEPHPEMQGVDQLPSWSDQSARVREGVLIESKVEARLHVESWVTDRYRLSMYSDLGLGRTDLELYDFQEDPHEFESVSEDPAYSGVLKDLLTEAHHSSVELKAPWPRRVVPS
jgi:uncharacterized sulfatase